jgi:hypothetical protein
MGVETIRRIANEMGLFRERDVTAAGGDANCLDDARVFGFATPHGHGVWSHPEYKPTRYELVQIRMRKAVFWGPSALWLLGAEKTEPEAMWIALGNNFRRPPTLELDTVVIRTRNLEKNVELVQPPGCLLVLRVHSVERALADIARHDCVGLLDRDLRPRQFTLHPDGDFLSAHSRAASWSPPAEGCSRPGADDWIVARSFSPEKAKVPPRARWLRY